MRIHGSGIAGAGVAFYPDTLTAPEAEPAAIGTPYSAVVAQTGGRILYDPDPEEGGKEPFHESLYAEFPETLECARRYSGNGSGMHPARPVIRGFGHIVNKEAFRTTIGIHGKEWRPSAVNEI